jgi:hypothetical protein
MGYLTDNIPVGRNFAFCQDLYLYRLIVKPQFASDFQLSSFVKDEVPDVEEWQFSGRRRCPVAPPTGRAQSSRRQVHPATWAQNSRYMRAFTEEVFYAFHTEAQRAQVAARLDQERYSYRLVNEPGVTP